MKKTLVTALSLLSTNAFAVAQLQFNSVTYLKNSLDRTSQVSYLSLGPKFETNGKLIESVIDLKAIAFLAERSSFTAEAPQAYLSTSKELSSLHQVSVGRRWYSWSLLDDRWRMGLYNPRFTWDPIYPETIGLTGGFYSYESKYVSFVAYGSPLAIPERGSNLSIENGQIISPQPLMKPMPNLVTGIIGNSQTPIYYSMQLPSIQAMLLRPNGAVSLKVRSEGGLFATGNFGYLPIHQADLVLDTPLSAANNRVDATILPQFRMQQIAGVETGYQQDAFTLWASAQRQTPNTAPISLSPTMISNSIGPATLLAAGADFHLLKNDLKLSATILNIDETLGAQTGTITVSLPSRFWYKKAFQFGALYGNSDSKLLYTANFINDVEQISQLISFDVGYRPFVNRPGSVLHPLTVSLGTDFFSSRTGNGTIGQFAGDDRVRGRIAYAF